MCRVDPLDVDFPHVETLIHVKRDSTAYKDPTDRTCGYYVSSRPLQRHTPEQWMHAIRGHWAGIEIRNHWRKDACLHEDKTRSRNPNIVVALAMLRSCMIFFLAEDPHTSNINAFTEATTADSDKAMDMLTREY